jgi:hypothetical protein
MAHCGSDGFLGPTVIARSALRLGAIAILLAACTGVPSSSGGGPSPSSSEFTNGAGAPESGVIDPGSIPLDRSRDAILVAGDEEIAARASGRLGAGLDALVKDGRRLADALDRQESEALGRLVGPVGATTGQSEAPGVRLVSARIPRNPTFQLAAIVPPGMSLLGPFGAAMIIVDSYQGSGTAFEKSEHEASAVELGGSTGSVTTDTTVSVTTSGSRLIVDVQTRTKGEVTDQNGALVFRIDGTGHAHVEIDGCPGADGIAPATIELTANEEYFVADRAGRSGFSWSDDDKADARIVANDQAGLDREEVDLRTDTAVKGGTRAAGAGQSELVSQTVSATERLTMDPNGSATSSGGQFTATSVTRADVDNALRRAHLLLGLAVHTAGQAAERFWRSGKCLEVVVAPAGGNVGASSTTDVVVKVRHRFDGGELDKRVEATMTGTKAIEPAGQRVPAPATFVYTAGPAPGDTGTVTFKSVSNRGIGQSTVTFIVGGGWTVNRGQGGQTLTGQKCDGVDGPWHIEGRIKDSGLDQSITWVATIVGATMAGTYTYKSVSTTAGIVTTGTGVGAASLQALPDGTLKMTLAGTTIKQVVNGLGTEVTISVPIPDTPFTWSPGGTCTS